MLAGFLSYTRQSTGFFRRVVPKIRFEEVYDHGPSGRFGSIGAHTDRLVSSYIDMMLPAATSFSFGYTRAFLRVEDIDFPGLDRGFVYLGSQALRAFGWDLFIRGGEDVIFDDAVDAGPPLPATFVTASLTTANRPFPPLRIGLDRSTSRVWRRSATRWRESRYAESAIPRFKGQLQVDRRLGLRLIGEYRIERFYARSGSLAAKREGSTDVLVTYLVYPGQSLQLGWSTLANGDRDVPLRTVARGGVAKLTYLWRF